MQDTAKYLIHADVTADGVVERSDVVGAVFGQTEGLLGAEMDLRRLQEASKVGRIDVDVESEGGRSFGEVTIAASLDRVETAVLAAALETIGRVGPCRAEFRVTGIEDVRAAKRRSVVDRAKELATDSFDDGVLSTQELLEEVRRSIRVEDITEYEGLPAGPNVADSDAIIVVEGRADVLQLLRYGVKNAIAVEGTDVPDTVAKLTEDRTVTAFLDGDRGGDLVLRELAQVGDVDYVAVPPSDESVEDLSRRAVLRALREKVPYEAPDDSGGEVAVTDGSVRPAPGGGEEGTADAVEASTEGTTEAVADPVDASADGTAEAATDAGHEPTDGTAEGAADGTSEEPADGTAEEPTGGDADATAAADREREPETLRGHVGAVAGEGTVRLLDGEFAVQAEAPAEEAFEALEGAEPTPSAVVLDGELSQRVLDVAAQRGVGQVVARKVGDLVKRPTGVRVRTADQLLAV